MSTSARALCSFSLGEGIRAYDPGCFCLSGEAYYLMCHQYALERTLKRMGFSTPLLVAPADPVDTEPDGSVYKTDPFYMEAIHT
jgi:hypothetical protein